MSTIPSSADERAADDLIYQVINKRPGDLSITQLPALRELVILARASLGAAQVPAKPLDDQRLQQAFGDAIEGALAFGFQGNNAPPEGHWLTRFWNIGRAEATKGAAQVPARQVAFPETDDEAAGMVALGTDWLNKHAPERLGNLAGESPRGDPNDESRRQSGFRDQALWDRGYAQGHADGESSAGAAQVPSLSDPTLDAIVDAVRRVMGGVSGDSNLVQWAERRSRARAAIRAALSQPSQQGTK